MRILVTGGTGFVGSHTVAALLRQGHEVRLFVRDPDRIPPALAPLGIHALPYAVGDVTDPDAVDKAMQGCDALLHAASVYSLDVRDAERMRQVNPAATETVLREAHANGLDPIVYVSSHVALFPPEGRTLTVDSPVKQPSGAYYRSKADAERVARDFQARGAPVVISYPSGVFGPHDPHGGESTRVVRSILARQLPLIPPGGLSVVDVRDLAQAQAAMFEAGRGPRRYMLSGTFVELKALVDQLADLTGRRIPRARVPAWCLRPAIRLASAAQRFVSLRLPVSEEGFNVIVWCPRGDDSQAIRDLGFSPRDLRQTLIHMCIWALREGWITKAQAGRLAEVATP